MDNSLLNEWETECWPIVSAFIDNRGIVQQQIDSYNEFLPDLIQKLIRGLPPIVLKDHHGTRHTLQFGGGLPADVTISRPRYTEVDKEDREVFPSTARARNFTYASAVSAKIKWTVNKVGKAEEFYEAESNKLRFLGYVPIMVRSDSCHLKGKTDDQLYRMNECPLDPGGYFIVNGRERVIIGQERAATNSVFVFPSAESKDTLECEIRSTVEATSASAHAFWVHFRSARKVKAANKKTKLSSPRLLCRLPSLSRTVDANIMFQALGFDSDLEIFENVIAEEETEDSRAQHMREILIHCFKSRRLDSQAEAKIYLGDLAVRPDLDDDERRQFTEHLLNHELLPHLGETPNDYRRKALFLCHMIRRLLVVNCEFRLSDDRDHLQNKRYFFAGPLMAQMFYRTLRTMHSELRAALERRVQHKKTLNGCLNLGINSSIISKGMAFSLATGNWGDLRKATTRIYKGVSQELNRLTYASLISSLRRVCSPEDKLHLMVKPRQIHNTYWGMICPCETPEGKPVGLVKNLALQAIITVASPAKDVREYLLSSHCGVLELIQSSYSIHFGKMKISLPKVFVNGNWLGFHENPQALVDHLRRMRQLGGTPITTETSVTYTVDAMVNEIEIRTDAGRLSRPLLIVRDGQLLITREHIDKLRSDASFGWRQLLLEGVVEMIDTRESENVVIAMDPEKLQNPPKHTVYTHMEISPSLILGICAGVIPYSEHNQAPRNVYQSAIAKQAMGVYVTNFHTRLDTSAHVLFYPQKPLATTRMAEYTRFRELPAGINCIVAIATYQGYNQEDSLILNRAAIDRGLFRSTQYHTYQDKSERNAGRGDQDELFGIPDRVRCKGLRLVTGEEDSMVRYSKLEEDGLPPPGTRLNEDDAIIGKCMRIPNVAMADIYAAKASHDADNKRFQEERAKKGLPTSKPREYNVPTRLDKSTYLRKPSTGVVDTVLVTWNADGLRLVKVRVRTMLTPQVGDKFASLHGQKGVVGMIFPEEDLFFTKDGIIPDIIINPHGIPSRMTIGQLIESVAGKAATMTGKIADGTPFTKTRAFELKAVRRVLKIHGFHEMGNEVMYNGHTGRKLMAQIFIGPTYYQRLRHLVDEKIHSRARGSVNNLTRQPVQGFARDGGLRFGEMERDCVISHGTALFLMERMLEVSDLYYMNICNHCGLIVSTRPAHVPRRPYFVCTNCSASNSYGASSLRVPYACKLLLQELMCMNITVRITPNSCIED